MDDVFYRFIYERVNATHRRGLDSYLKDDPCSAGYLASAIRHLFAHGWFTPSANQVHPDIAAAVCSRLCDFLIRVMDEEFGSRVAAGMDDRHGRLLIVEACAFGAA